MLDWLAMAEWSRVCHWENKKKIELKFMDFPMKIYRASYIISPSVGIYSWKRTFQFAAKISQWKYYDMNCIFKKETQLSMSKDDPENWERSNFIESANRTFWFTLRHIEQPCPIFINREGNQKRIGSFFKYKSHGRTEKLCYSLFLTVSVNHKNLIGCAEDEKKNCDTKNTS